MIVMSRPLPPPCCDWNETRASAIWLSCGAIARSNSTLVRWRSLLRVRKMLACPTLMSEKAESTSGARRTMRATCSATRWVCSSVEPGTSSMLIWL